jgi:ABC-type glycerol-3-phosphate transport system substrate-binding protein
MRKLHLLLLPALLLALTLGLAACGGSGESDEDKITNTIETATTSKDPAVCGETQTLKFMEQTVGGAGKEAEKRCEEEAKAGVGNPDSVTISKIKVNGEKATADVEFKGGNFNEQTLEVALIEEGGEWKLNEFVGFAKFDPSTFIQSLTKQLENEPSLKPTVASCIIEGVEEFSKSELEALVVENNTQAIVEVAEGCE